MRTYTNSSFTNCTVLGFGQVRVVVSSVSVTCARAAQHHARHAGKRAGGLDRDAKRRDWAAMAMTGAALLAERLRLAIIGPQWQPVRLVSPELVTA